ncbi:proline-rich protein 19 [Rhineura floridana]|uniref:proline-rich protein 19 n=1 Tax=Rhineura floridana TaxID=261503 RepID=UPI002AC841C2|nr:proline-rich protein 19 [Rhineura floridana]XP_061453893.1 proline-rich protein 19 [Rhineura floridana]XP_061453894.1 proline-rich protein 19 [Rhineura floridana]XP_061453895.1 proline-rich protein 19 [Rhineura floridana]XP_061453896.1 proline-rich protein 19 [Rhineura floridana]
MNPYGKREGRKQSLASFGFPCSSHQLKASPSEQHSTEEKSARVKRRRTRRERNYVKFGRNVTDRVPEQRLNCRTLQKALPPFWSSQFSNCAKSTPIRPIKGTCVAKPVIITQNRLSQHLGMFNREVKSADIERLVSPRTQQEVMEITPIQRDSRVEMLQEEEVHSCKSCDADQKSIPSEQLGCNVKDPCGVNKDSFLTVVPAVPTLIIEHSVTTLPAIDAGSQPLAAPAILEFSQESAGTEAFQSNVLMALNEKENVPPVPAAETDSGKGKNPAKELAQDLQKLLDLKAIFPGRNLVSETRQAIISIVLEQKKLLPDFSALVVLKKLACNSDITHADFRSPPDRKQEELQLEQKSSDGSRNSNQGVSLKNRRGREQCFPSSLSPCPMHTAIKMADKKPTQRENFKSFAEPEVFDQHNFYLAAVQPRPHLSSISAQHVNLAKSSFASEDQRPLHDTLFRTARHWEQGLGEAFCESRIRQERSEIANRVLPRKNISKRYCLPFVTHDSLGSGNLSMNGKGSGHFILTDPQQNTCVYELSPDRWNLRETEPVPVHSLHPAQELCSSQLLDLGLRPTERTASESQTSFDVLKSIWSPKVPSKGAKLPVSRALDYPPLVHQPPSCRELTSDHGQPKEFLQLYSIIPQQYCSSYKQNPQHDACMLSKHPPHRNGLFSVLAKPRAYCQKVSGEQGKASNSYQFWALAEAPERMQRNRDKGCSASGNQACDLERLLQMEEAQQLQIFQKLPMSYFPPSEALENRNSPLCTLQGHLLEQSSPEPWAFPRMKLY